MKVIKRDSQSFLECMNLRKTSDRQEREGKKTYFSEGG